MIKERKRVVIIENQESNVSSCPLVLSLYHFNKNDIISIFHLFTDMNDYQIVMQNIMMITIKDNRHLRNKIKN